MDVTDQTLTNIPFEDGDGSEMIGHTIDGRYHLEATLGRGGMGVVYRATHVTLRRRAAVKILHPSLVANADVRNRFEREARASGKIDHPNCVAVYDSGHLSDGSIYLAMELLEGESLADILQREGQLPVPRALHILAHVLRGLAHVHQSGLVHRDIKPENIFLVRNGDDPDFAKILDFGIAKPMRGELSDDGVKLTQAGMAFGTPIYMAPEQALGNRLDGRADVYAAAVVGYEMLAGKPPFYSEDKLEVMSMHTAKPVPPMRRNMASGGKPVPSSIERVIVRGLTKKVADRYESADAMLAAVESAMQTTDGGDTAVEFERLDADPDATGARPLLSDSGQVKIVSADTTDEAPPVDSPRLQIHDAIDEVLRAKKKQGATPARGTVPERVATPGRGVPPTATPARGMLPMPAYSSAPPRAATQPPPPQYEDQPTLLKEPVYQPPSVFARPPTAPPPPRAPSSPVMNQPTMNQPMMHQPPNAMAMQTGEADTPDTTLRYAPPQPGRPAPHVDLLVSPPPALPFPMPGGQAAPRMSRRNLKLYGGIAGAAVFVGIIIAVATSRKHRTDAPANHPGYARDAYAAVDKGDLAQAQSLLDANKPASQRDALAILVQGLIYNDGKDDRRAVDAFRAAVRTDATLGDDPKLRADLEALVAGPDRSVLADALDVWCSTGDPAAIRATDVAATAVDDPARHDAAMSALARHPELADKVDLVVADAIDLQTADTCEHRKAALQKLKDLRDPRAVPIVDVVRRDPRNRCLANDAAAALTALRGAK